MYTERAVCLSVNVRTQEYNINMNPQEKKPLPETLQISANPKGGQRRQKYGCEVEPSLNSIQCRQNKTYILTENSTLNDQAYEGIEGAVSRGPYTDVRP